MKTLSLTGEYCKYLNIYEGNLDDFKISEDFIINISSVNFIDEVPNLPSFDYLDDCIITFKNFSFLNLTIEGLIDESKIIIGELNPDDVVLYFEGTCGNPTIAKNYPTSFELEIVCNKINLVWPDKIS